MKAITAIITALGVVSVAAVPAATGNGACVPPASTASCTTTILTVLATGAAATAPSNTPAANAAPANRSTLGGPPPPVISGSGDRPFSVNGDTFVGVSAALGRSCDIQHNTCANAANAGTISAEVSDCDDQNTQCHAANNLKKRLSLDARRASSPASSVMMMMTERATLDLGSCSDASIVFGEGIDGRNTAAFVPANQQDFDHGSALNIGVVAGFICQRLDSPCNAPADTQASCAQASAAAVAVTQDQGAADAWNAIMGNGGGAAAGGSSNVGASGPTAASVPEAVITPAPALAAMPSPAVQLMTFSSCS
ncbi:hypothetical protein N0V82_003282 [Gnomoniopsis sp. IMI 355080]|nr:hypothetical protein N0V82_003282 [Gnomoniopsis sp. IMI 355080]